MLSDTNKDENGNSVLKAPAGKPPVAPPYPILASALLDGDVIPFIGAGVNSGVLPTGTQLSRSLARECSFPSARESDLEDLAKVSSYFVEVGSRVYLRRYLRKTFCREVGEEKIGSQEGNESIHEYLAYLAQPGKPLLIVTTNYDDLTETAFNNAGKPYDLVIHPTDRDEWKASVLWWEDLGLDKETDGRKAFKAVHPSRLNINLKEKTVIYKMHGTVHRQRKRWDSYVITEDDYVEFLGRMMGQSAVPSQFMHHFQKRRFLFMGYGLGDWNFRVVLRKLREVLSPKKEGQDEFQELLTELTLTDPMMAEWLKKKIITPAQAVKMLEVQERRLAIKSGSATPEDLFEEEEDDEDDSIDQQGPARSWAVQYQPTDLERRLWERRGVDIYDVKIGEFVERLHFATQEARTEMKGGTRRG